MSRAASQTCNVSSSAASGRVGSSPSPATVRASWIRRRSAVAGAVDAEKVEDPLEAEADAPLSATGLAHRPGEPERDLDIP